MISIDSLNGEKKKNKKQQQQQHQTEQKQTNKQKTTRSVFGHLWSTWELAQFAIHFILAIGSQINTLNA